MANGNALIKSFISTEGRFVVVTLLLITFLFSAGFSQAKINNQDLKEIETALEITNFPFLDKYSEKQLKEILNKAIKPKEQKITYGILIQSAFNEMEFMDMILSQRFLDINKKYFNSVLDERLSLFNHWKKVGQNIYSLAKKGKSVGPFAGLAMESVEITNKTIDIFIALEVWRKTKTYKGLWRYFDERRNGESHKGAWELAGPQAGWAAKTKTRFKGAGSSKIDQLGAQFSALWDKWGLYATPYGISKEYKEQMASELRSTLATALETHTFVKEEPEIPLTKKLTQQVDKIRAQLAALVARVNPFQAGPMIDLPEATDLEEPVEAWPQQVEVEPSLDEIQEDLDDILEEVDIISEDTSEIFAEELVDVEPRQTEELDEGLTEEILPEEDELEEIPKESVEVEPQQAEPESESGLPETEEPSAETGSPQAEEPEEEEPRMCEKIQAGSPTRFRVLINEVAWMGTADSANDEWIELKNIWGIPVNLSGWQLLDKDQKIKIIFGEDDIIPANGFYLLERTDDDSAPNVPADLIYSGALNDTNEALSLFDNNCRLEDEAAASSNWPAGDKSGRKSMERFDAFKWYTYRGSAYNGILGTPKRENSPPPVIYHRRAAPIEILPPSQLLITEIKIEGTAYTDHDFVELYNPTYVKGDISGFRLRKKSSTGNEYSVRVFPKGSIIPAFGYFLWANYGSADAVSSQTLAKNNSIAIMDKDENIFDAASWGTSTNPFIEGQSFPKNPDATESLGRKWSTTTQSYIDTGNNQNDFEIQSPTPKTKNQSPASGDDEEGGGEGGGGGGETETGSLSVVINEIAWMGTDASYNDEWIELYNNTTSTINLTGWRLISSDGSPNITFSTSTISAGGFYLIERTADDTVSDISADWSGSFGYGLNNSGEKLELRDASNNLIDVVDGSSDWFAGEASPNYISMERINPQTSGSDSDNWAGNNRVPWDGWQGKDANGIRINGTPKSKNSVTKTSTTVSPGGFNIDNDFTLVLPGSPYLIEGSINVSSGAKLTVEPGVVIKIKDHTSLNSEFKIEGDFEAIGGTNQKIVFTSYKDDEYGGDTNNDGTGTQPARGDWDWFYFKDSTATLENVIMRYGGKYHKSCCYEYPPYTKGMLKVENGQISIKNSLIEQSYTRGLWLDNSSGTIENSEFSNNGSEEYLNSAAIYIESQNGLLSIKNSNFGNNKIGIWIGSGVSPSVEDNVFEGNQTPIQTATLLSTFSGNTAQNNNLNGILVNGFGFSAGVSLVDWEPANLPYILESSATVFAEKTLNIKPGVIIKLKGSGRIYVEGNLKAEGQQSNKIVFTSINDDEYGGDTNNNGTSTQPTAGNWDYIHFSASSLNSIFDNVIVRYGGWYDVFQRGAGAKSGAVKAEASSLTIRDSIFENNLYAGLELDNSTSTFKNTDFKNNAAEYSFGSYSAGLRLVQSNPSFSNPKSLFENNYYGIYVESGPCPSLSKINFGTGDEAYFVDVYPASCSP